MILCFMIHDVTEGYHFFGGWFLQERNFVLRLFLFLSFHTLSKNYAFSKLMQLTGGFNIYSSLLFSLPIACKLIVYLKLVTKMSFYQRMAVPLDRKPIKIKLAASFINMNVLA